MALIVLLAGLPGVGKSTLAAPLSRALDAGVVDRDHIKANIFPARYLTHSPAQVALATLVAAEACETILAEHNRARVIVDGHTFSRRRDVDRYRRIAAEQGARLCIVHCVVGEEVIAARIAGDPDGLEKDRTWAKYVEVRNRFEPLEGEVLSVDLSGTAVSAVEEIMAYLRWGHRHD